MSGSSKTMRAALKRLLVPHLASQGFTGKFPQFRRIENGTLHLLSVEFDKWGGGFFLEFVQRPAGDMEMPWGEVVAEGDLTPAHTPFESRARLQETGSPSSMPEMWFRYDCMDRDQCEQLVNRVIELFPQVNDWLREYKAGPNISAT